MFCPTMPRPSSFINITMGGTYNLHSQKNTPTYISNSLWIKPTDALNSNFIGITTLHVSGVLSRTSALVHFMQLWWPFATPGSKRSSQLHKMYQSQCRAKNSWWWAARLPKTCRVVIPIKLEFSASVGFIHEESVMMDSHMIVKYIPNLLNDKASEMCVESSIKS
jgi:hypothetical protein